MSAQRRRLADILAFEVVVDNRTMQRRERWLVVPGREPELLGWITAPSVSLSQRYEWRDQGHPFGCYPEKIEDATREQLEQPAQEPA